MNTYLDLKKKPRIHLIHQNTLYSFRIHFIHLEYNWDLSRIHCIQMNTLCSNKYTVFISKKL